MAIVYDFNNLIQPSPHSNGTYATFRLTWLDEILFSNPDCQGIRCYPATAVVGNQEYRSVLAVGYTANGNFTAGKVILLDDLPCPPECHPPENNESPKPTPTYDRLTLAEAEDCLADYPFSAKFPLAEIEALRNAGADKIRVFFAWTFPNSQTPTFLVRSATLEGDEISNIYLHDPNPVSLAQL